MTGERVLVIEHQTASERCEVERALSPSGYRVTTSPGAEQGVQQALDIAPDLIVLHADAVDQAYLATLTSLRERGITAPALVVLPAGADDLDLRAVDLGASDAVREPLSEDAVREAVDRALTESRLERLCARMEARLQDQLEEQRRLYAIGQALASQTDYQQVCAHLVEAAVHLVQADEGSLFLRDPATGEIRVRVRLVAGQMDAESVDEPVRDPQVERALLASAPRLLTGTPTLIDVPLVSREQSRGVLRVSVCQQDAAFDAFAYHKLSVLASYAALALDNAQLMQSVEDAIERTALCQIGAYFVSELREDKVLETVLEVAMRVVAADAGHIVLLDPRKGTPRVRVAHGVGADEVERAVDDPRQQIVQRVIQTRTSEITEIEPAQGDGKGHDGHRCVLCVPIDWRSGPLGAMCLERLDPERSFTAHDRSMTVTLAANAAIAIQNARLFQRTEAESRRLDAVLQGTGQPIIVTDEMGVVHMINRAAMLALNLEPAQDDERPYAIDHPQLNALLDQALLSEEVQHAEIVTHDQRTYSATVTPLPGVGIVTALQDMTEVKRLSELKTEFVSKVSHDLRSPLSVVQGFLAVLDQAGPLNARQLDFIASAQRELMYLFDLTSDLIDLGQVESGINVELVPCDLVQVADNAVRSWQNTTAKRRHSLVATLPLGEVRVLGNAGLLRRAIDNLLSNAVKYTPPGGKIEVRITRSGPEAVVQVKDNGLGIAPADQPYVFDRFYRAEDAIARNIKGSGLGLSIVRSIAESHGGRVWLESEPGAGTTVGFVLPVMTT